MCARDFLPLRHPMNCDVNGLFHGASTRQSTSLPRQVNVTPAARPARDSPGPRARPAAGRTRVRSDQSGPPCCIAGRSSCQAKAAAAPDRGCVETRTARSRARCRRRISLVRWFAVRGCCFARKFRLERPEARSELHTLERQRQRAYAPTICIAFIVFAKPRMLRTLLRL